VSFSAILVKEGRLLDLSFVMIKQHKVNLKLQVFDINVTVFKL